MYPETVLCRTKELAIKNAINKWEADCRSPTMIRLHFDSSIVDWSPTSQKRRSATGHFPIHLGHLGSFRWGVIPKPVVDDPTYFQAVCEYEQVWGDILPRRSAAGLPSRSVGIFAGYDTTCSCGAISPVDLSNR